MSGDRLRQLARGPRRPRRPPRAPRRRPPGADALAGWPLPHALPSLESIRRALEQGWLPAGTVVIKALAVVCWAAWAELAACAAVETPGRRPP